MPLDAEAARRAITTRIAEPLGLDLIEAASGILRVANATMARGIRVVSVERGHDPRRLTLVPFGGAGPMHGSPLARELAIPRLLIPPTPGILCALGMLVADLRHDLVQTRLAAHRDLSPEEARAVFEPMLAEARRLLDADRVPGDRQRIEMRLDMRYVGQSYELPIPIAGFSEAAVGGAGPGIPRRARAPLRPQRPRGAGRDRQLRRDRDRADRHAGTAATAAGRRRTAGRSATRQPPRVFRGAAHGTAPAGPSARSGGARRCSPETRSPGRRSSRKSRRRRCSTPATAPMSMRSAA